MILAVATLLNEADLIGDVISNLYNNGVDEIHVALSVASDDGTREILEGFPVRIVDDDEPYHYQPRWINALIADGAAPSDVIVPFDGDEFHYVPDGRTLREALDDPTIKCCQVVSYQHRDRDYMYTRRQGLSKVVFRYEPGCAVANGNHSVYLPSQPRVVPGLVALREIQFRSRGHLDRKCGERTDRLDPALPYTEGTHQRVLAAMSPEERDGYWSDLMGEQVVYDPIPVR